MARTSDGHFMAASRCPKKTLLGLLERGHGGGLRAGAQRLAVLGDAGGLQGRVDVLVDDPKRPGVAVPDVALGLGQRVLEDVDLDAVVGERARLVEAEGLQVPGDDLHGGDPAALHRGDEVGAVVERGRVPAPEPEARRVGEAVHGGGAGGRGVQHPRVRQRVLQAQSGKPLLRRLCVAALPGGGAGGVGHGVRLVEDDDAVEGMPRGVVGAAREPLDDLVQPCRGFAARRGTQRCVGGEQDPALAVDGLRGPVVGKREDVALVAADLAPVAPGVLQQACRLADPERLPGAAQPAVEDDGGGLAALAAAGAVAEHPALAEPHRVRKRRVDGHAAVEEFAVGVDRQGAHPVRIDPVAVRQQLVVRLAGEGHALELRLGQKAVGDQGGRQHGTVVGHRRRDVGHGGGLHQRSGMLGRTGDVERDRRPRRPGGAAGAALPAFARHGLDVEFPGLGIERQARRQVGETAHQVRRVLDHRERIEGGIAVGGRRRCAFEHEQARLDAGAAPLIDAAGDAGREQDARGGGAAAEGVAPGGGLRDAVGAGDGDQPPARRERRVGRLEVQQVDVLAPLADGRTGGERRVHQHDVRTYPRQAVADVLGVVPGHRGVRVDLREQGVADRRQLVQKQARRIVEDGGGQRGEHAGPR